MPKATKQTPRGSKKTSAAPKGGLLAQAIDLEDMEQTGIKMLVYGQSGTGKTTFLSGLPKPIFWMVCSGGNKPGELKSIKNVKGIKRFVIENTEQIKQVTDELATDTYYKSVVLDHATGTQDKALAEILGEDEVAVQSSWGQASQQQYGQCTLRMKEYFRSILNLDQNVGIIAQEREFNNDGDDDLILPYVGAALSPSVVGWLNPAVDYVVQTFKRPRMVKKTTKVGKKTVERWVRAETGKKVEYCLRTGPDSTYITKFRVPKGTELPDVIADPTFDKVQELLN